MNTQFNPFNYLIFVQLFGTFTYKCLHYFAAAQLVRVDTFETHCRIWAVDFVVGSGLWLIEHWARVDVATVASDCVSGSWNWGERVYISLIRTTLSICHVYVYIGNGLWLSTTFVTINTSTLLTQAFVWIKLKYK